MEKMIIAYLRVSTDKQADKGNSLDVQRKDITEELVGRRGYDLESITFLEDGGYSAGSMKRPKFQTLLSLVKKIGFN